MKILKTGYLIIILFTLVLFSAIVVNEDALLVFNQKEPQNESYLTTAKRDLLALIMAYPEYIAGVNVDNGNIYVLTPSEKEVLYDDGQQKDFAQKLACADIQDMMEMVYPLEDIETLMEGNFDPGRVRTYGFLKEVYGGSQSSVEKNLKGANLGSGIFPFNKNNGASSAIENVFKEISDLCAADGSVYGFVYPLCGTYNYRVIAGTNQLSPHAFGIAIDLSSDPKDYWRWATREQGQKRLDSYPREIVSIFENNGFIWGGKWAHFDILHFEYRPELILKSRYYDEPEEGRPWHTGFPETEEITNYIKIIDSAFD